ncbi:hypothetical protein Adt_19962 [Abeliophyllum distichum]|uniref:Uncharacterized protein n=1 Tax=Abeliophyllum distichum TaxID=126358 RepID=A0ABD1SUG2_9LAMI
MINYSCLTSTSEETRSWHPNNDSTRGSTFNARTAQGRYLRSKILAQGPLPLGLGHLAACSSQGTQPRSRASPTGTRPPSSLFLPRNTTSLKGHSHWDSAT